MTRNALGRGLGALIREPEPQVAPQVTPQVNRNQQDEQYSTTPSGEAVAPARDGSQTLRVDIDLIEPSPFQPRTTFREAALEELSRSILASGIIQPLLLRPVGNQYEYIAGERRWRAAQLAGLTKVPAIVRDVPNELALEMTLVENIQREDLNPIESARAFDRLINEFHMTLDRKS